MQFEIRNMIFFFFFFGLCQHQQILLAWNNFWRTALTSGSSGNGRSSIPPLLLILYLMTWYPGSLGFPITIYNPAWKHREYKWQFWRLSFTIYEIAKYLLTFKWLWAPKWRAWGCFFQGSSFKSNRNILARSLDAILPTYSSFRFRSSIMAETKSPTSRICKRFSYLLLSLHSFLQLEFPSFLLVLRGTVLSIPQRRENARGWWRIASMVTYCGPRQPWHASFPSLPRHTNNASLTSSSCWTRGAIGALKSTKDKTTLLSFQ